MLRLVLAYVSGYYASRALDALGDPTRRAVFARLRAGARSVGEIAAGLAVTRPAVSQRLRILRRARLVVDRAEGRDASTRSTKEVSGTFANGSTDFGTKRSTRSSKRPSIRRPQKGSDDE